MRERRNPAGIPLVYDPLSIKPQLVGRREIEKEIICEEFVQDGPLIKGKDVYRCNI